MVMKQEVLVGLKPTHDS